MECAVCEKTFYGHASASGEVVCGSCALTSTAKGKKKSKLANVDSMQLNLYKESMKELERNESKEPTIVDKIRVKSNYARNRVVVIGGRSAVVLSFNEDGECTIDGKHREVVEGHIRLVPNRFSIVEDAPPVKPEPEVELVKAIVIEEPEPAPEPEVVEEKPAPEPKKKAAKKPKKTSKKRKKKSGK